MFKLGALERLKWVFHLESHACLFLVVGKVLDHRATPVGAVSRGRLQNFAGVRRAYRPLFLIHPGKERHHHH